MRNRGPLFLMLGLASLVAIEVVGLTGKPENDFVPAVPSDSTGQGLDFKAISGPPQLAARPLFRQTRRPPEVPVQDGMPRVEPTPSVPSVSQAPSEQVPALQHQLTAVAITGGEAIAYLVDSVNLDLIRLKKGDQIDGWILREIFPDAVVLGYGTQQRARLELWADARKEEFPVHLNEDQDAQGDFERSQGELSASESLPTETPGRPVRGPRTRVR